MKKAFTLIELVIVIVVLGIVSMIGTDIITHMYESYLKSKVINKLQTRTDEVLNLLAKRLAYRIKDSAVTSINGNPSTYKKLSDKGITESHNVLEWIGYDNEGMIGEWDGARFSGWSGFVDVDNSLTTKASLVSSGSRFDLANLSILSLSDSKVSIYNTSSPMMGLIFKCLHNMEPRSYGYITSGYHPNVYNIYSKNTPSDVNKLYFVDTTPKDVCEQYYLAWSAYAIVPEGPNKDDFNLTLKYNYRPWEGERFYFANTSSAVLAEHVSTFKFIQVGHTLRMKLCLRDPQTSYGFCKEKAVY